MPSELEIGRLIGGLRVDRGLTQRKLAELAGIRNLARMLRSCRLECYG